MEPNEVDLEWQDSFPREVIEHYERGMSIIPIGIEKGGKKPLVRWKRYQTEQPTKREMLRWLRQFGPDIVAWARITGERSGLIVLDFEPDSVALMERWGLQAHVRTGRRGYHWIGEHPGWHVATQNSQSNKRLREKYPHVDIRGDGGYSIICGANAKGRYEWLRDPEPDDLDALPPEVRRFYGLFEPPREHRNDYKSLQGCSDDISTENRPKRDYLVRRALEKIESDGRNNAGFWLACQLRDNEHTREQALVAGQTFLARCPTTNTKGDVEDYGMDDFAASVEQAYSQPAREPWGARKRNGATPADEDETGVEEAEQPKPTKAKNLDDNLARAWAENVGDRVVFVEGSQWWRYNDTERHWTQFPTDGVEISVQRFLRSRGCSLSVKRIREVLTLARDYLGPVPMALFDARPDLIPLANGLYHVPTRTLIAHAPSYRNTFCLGYNYDPEARCPLTEAFLAQVLIREDGSTCAEWVQFAWEWLGYCLTADSRAHVALLNVGEGGNGKGTFARLLRALVGLRQCAAVSIEKLPDYYTRASLVGKLVAFVSEPDRRALQLGGEQLKAISAGDDTEARHPYGRVFTFTPVVKFVISCNALPETKDLSNGFFRRPVILQWRHTPPKPDTELDHKLSAELPGVFNRAVEGLERFRARGNQFGPLPESDRLKADYRKSQDTAALFLEDCCIFPCEGGATPNDRLYQVYVSWCERNGFRGASILTSVAFGKALTRLGVPQAAVTWDEERKKATKYRPYVCLNS